MRTASTLCIVSALVACRPNVATQTSTNATVLAIENVTVIPMDSDRVLPSHTVLIDGTRIVRIGPVDDVRVPRNARRIDGRGIYLAPGLADMHVHIRSEMDFLSYLAFGVTTVFNLGGSYPEAPDLLRYRRELAANERVGPTLYTSGPLLDGNPPIFAGVSEPVATPDEAVAAVRRQHQAGYDFVKTYNWLSPAAFNAAVAEAHTLGVAIGGHIPEKVSVDSALNARITLIAHGSAYLKGYLDSADRPDTMRLRSLAKRTRETGTTVIPNLIYSATFASALHDSAAAFADPEARFVAAAVLAAWRRTPPRMLLRWNGPPSVSYPLVQQLARTLEQEDVGLLVGSDFPAMQGLFPGQGTVAEVRELEKAGLTRYQAFAAATVNAGAFVRRHVDTAARFGVIAPGFRADLLLLRSNPLDDLAALANPVAIVVRGRYLSHDEIARLREAARIPK